MGVWNPFFGQLTISSRGKFKASNGVFCVLLLSIAPSVNLRARCFSPRTSYPVIDFYILLCCGMQNQKSLFLSVSGT
jgi:hypothetical protein